MKNAFLIILLAALSGCAGYQAEPLDSKRHAEAGKMPFRELASHRFDPEDGFDMTELATLAVVNNPGLRLARDDLGISRAQAFAAGLLPDPKISFSPQFPQNGIPGENVTAFDLGLSYDISSLVMRSSRIAVADAETRKTDLALLWQEWQVVGQARLLFVRSLMFSRLRDVLTQEERLAKENYRAEHIALDEGNSTLDAEQAAAASLDSVESQLSANALAMGKNNSEMNKLLGLPAGAKLHLVGDANLPIPSGIGPELQRLVKARPDMRALAAGYEAQDRRLRAAILAQFPAISVGFVRARDNTGINYEGFSVSLNLPIFNRNRGNIAIARATRQRMHDEYQARLHAATGDAQRLLKEQALMKARLEQIEKRLRGLEPLSTFAGNAFRAGNIDRLSYARTKHALLGAEAEKIVLQQNILEGEVALLTMTGPEK